MKPLYRRHAFTGVPMLTEYGSQKMEELIKKALKKEIKKIHSAKNPERTK